VWAHLTRSQWCKPLTGSLSGRRIAPLSTASAIDRSRARCTAWCSSTRPASTPTPRPARVPSCRSSSRTSRRLPRMRHSGPPLPETALRRARARQAAGFQLQAARVLPVARRRPRHTWWTSSSTSSGAAVSVVAADTSAFAAGRASRARHAGAAGGTARGHAPPSGPRRAQGRRGIAAAPKSLLCPEQDAADGPKGPP
jgi:hypothetical protein